MRGLEALYDAWLAGRKHNPGKTVLVRLAGVKPVVSKRRGQKSTIYEPIFEVVRWVKIPAEFEMPPERPAAPNGAAPRQLTPANGREKPAPALAKTDRARTGSRGGRLGLTVTAPAFDADWASPADWVGLYRELGLQVVPCHRPAGPDDSGVEAPEARDLEAVRERPCPRPPL